MRILFDAFWWAQGPPSNREVMKQFIFAWIKVFPEDSLVLAVPRGSVEGVRQELGEKVRVLGVGLRPHGISLIFEVSLLARRERVDWVLSHNFAVPYPLSAVFIHDLMFITNPEWFTWKERLYFSLMPMSARWATAVFTSSRSEAGRISRIVRDKTPALPVGIAGNSDIIEASPILPQFMDEIDVDGYFLCVGRLNARKNLTRAIEGALLSGLVTVRNPLVVVGEPSGKAADLPPQIRKHVAEGLVIFAGFLADDQVAWLYANTSLFIFVSLDEGFGMPLLEAAFFDAPILASDIPVFKELLGEYAIYVDPESVESISMGVCEAVVRQPHPVAPDLAQYSWVSSVLAMRAELVRIAESRKRHVG